MNDNRLPDAIIGRLSRVRTLESQLVDRLEELRTDSTIDRAPGEDFTRLLALAASHRLTLDESRECCISSRLTAALAAQSLCAADPVKSGGIGPA
jgi:hypothetical protein